MLIDLLGSLTLGVSLHRDRCAVRVGAGYHEHLVAAQALVAGEDIGGQVRAGKVTDVDIGIRVRPGNGDENVGDGRVSLRIVVQLLAVSD